MVGCFSQFRVIFSSVYYNVLFITPTDPVMFYTIACIHYIHIIVRSINKNILIFDGEMDIWREVKSLMLLFIPLFLFVPVLFKYSGNCTAGILIMSMWVHDNFHNCVCNVLFFECDCESVEHLLILFMFHKDKYLYVFTNRRVATMHHVRGALKSAG